jgi:hypothetical protein
MRRFLVVAFVLAAVMGAVGMDALTAGHADAQTVTQANPGGPYTGVMGSPIMFSGAASTGTITSYLWLFGDGTSGTGQIVSHIYSSAGTFTVVLTVTDSVGLQSTATTTATVRFAEVIPAPSGCTVTSAGVFCPRPAPIVTTVPTNCVVTAAGLVCSGVSGFTTGCFNSVAGFVCPGFSSGCFTSVAGLVCPGFTNGFGFSNGFAPCGVTLGNVVCNGAVSPFFNGGFSPFFSPVIGPRCFEFGFNIGCSSSPFIRN